MRFREQREAFMKLVVQQGIARQADLEAAMPFGCDVPPRIIDRWMRNMLEVPQDFSTQRRYVNHFRLGADPEFLFVAGAVRIDARMVNGMAQGLAYGMDNNGRLVEIRPYPSRSAVGVVASILSTLRWLALNQPETLTYSWVTGAYLFGDGLGGHVHFGRKRPSRDLEVRALDAIDEELLGAKAYPVPEVLRRRQGDERNQRYGLPGDIRPQLHGYEYRTFPSWLDSPELAFLTITLAKLAVHSPQFVIGFPAFQDVSRHCQRLRNLLSCYKDIDDDARLALKIIARKFPVHIGGDFKARWGIAPPAMTVGPKISFLPSSIKPTVEDIQEMFDYLDTGKALNFRVPTPTWGPLAPPEGYIMSISTVNTWQAKGLGEMLWDVCQAKDLKYIIINERAQDKRVYFSIPKELALRLPTGWQKFTKNHVRTHGDARYIYSYEWARCPATMQECRRILLQTVFPFWKVTEVKPDSVLQWKASLQAGKSSRKYLGEVLHGDIGQLAGIL
jgi:hypothetical protein